MIITNSVLDGLRTTVEAKFQNVFDTTPTWYQRLATEIPSNSKSNTYGWIMNSIGLREWVGPRISQNLQEHEYQIFNKLWEATVSLKRTDVEDDNLGVFASMVMPNLAKSTKKHPDTRLAAVIQANGTCFDGNAFFYASHPTYNTVAGGATTYSNVASAALDGDGVNTVRSQMAAYVGENNLPLGVVGNLLIVPPQLERAALTVMHSATYAVPTVSGGIGPTTAMATVDNVMKGWCDVLVVPEFANAPNTWYMADTSKPILPFVYQPRIPPELVARFNPQDPAVFDLDEYKWGVRARYELGFALPYLCVKVN